MKPTQFTARLEEKQVLNEKYTQFSFELVKPSRMEFQAGQYVSLQVSPDGTRRSYSICSSPGIDHGFELLIDTEPNGIGCQFLAGLEFGQEVSLLAPLGAFTIAEGNQEQELDLIATGSGIAPFYAMVQDLLQVKRDTRPINLYWGMRHGHHLFWLDEMKELMENFPNFHFTPILSQPEKDWSLSRGHVTDALVAKELKPDTGYYLCGSSAMIADVKQLLLDKGIAAEFIHHEKFF